MKKILFCAALLSVQQAVWSQNTKTVKPLAKPVVKTNTTTSATNKKPLGVVELKNGLDSFSYAAGVNIATNMKDQGIIELSLSAMMHAFDDVLNNKTLAMNNDQCGKTLQQKLQEFNEKKSSAQKAGGVDFLEKNKKRAGVITTASGLQYEVLTPGEANGQHPTAADTVVVDYVGTLIDGKEFDNSIKRGEPATFPLGGVIRGWTEVVQLMTKGAKFKVYIPYDLGYGERGAGGSIPPYSTLIFEITLHDIKPAVVK